MMRFHLTVWLLIGSLAAPAVAQQDYERAPINYHQAPVTDAVYKLQQAIEAGVVTLERDAKLGWLPAVLAALDVPANSQTLVFSKTSLQRRYISSANPRALYFNDDVYVGYVRHGKKIELSAVDPHLGAIFYTLDQQNRERPVITRDRGECLSCHATHRTRGVPGYLVRSVFADKRGEPLFNLGTTTTDHTTPFEKRFGGWYVTGSHGGMRHRGNVYADKQADQPIDPEMGANLASLDERIATNRYLQPGSDLVALMILEHQSQAHNLIARASHQARLGAYYDEGLNRIAERPAGSQSEGTKRRIAAAGEELLEYLLFSGEAPLDASRAGPVAGTSSFAADFTARGTRDSQGRSLRDFDLNKRLFRYPCSFLIDSEAIDQLPQPMLDYLRRRLTEVLTGEDQSAAFAHLSPEDRQAILEILRETKPELLL